mmetsp:Transcript_31350/g.104743  ORF Transcript_31350/g.104743 Transcript_31350/m.104743 type:complete len:247 (-) Transcript_31350:148-888(-)
MSAAPDTAPTWQPRASVSDDLCIATVRYVRLDATHNPFATDEGTDAYHISPGPVPARLLALLENIENDPKLHYEIGDRTFGLAMDVLTRYIRRGDPLTDEKKRSDAVLGSFSLACKFNETAPLTLKQLADISHRVRFSESTTASSIAAMEWKILAAINWELWELLRPDEARGRSEEGLRDPWDLGGQMPYSSQRRSRAARDDEHNAERDLANEAENKRRKAVAEVERDVWRAIQADATQVRSPETE